MGISDGLMENVADGIDKPRTPLYARSERLFESQLRYLQERRSPPTMVVTTRLRHSTVHLVSLLCGCSTRPLALFCLLFLSLSLILISLVSLAPCSYHYTSCSSSAIAAGTQLLYPSAASSSSVVRPSVFQLQARRQFLADGRLQEEEIINHSRPLDVVSSISDGGADDHDQYLHISAFNQTLIRMAEIDEGTEEMAKQATLLLECFTGTEYAIDAHTSSFIGRLWSRVLGMIISSWGGRESESETRQRVAAQLARAGINVWTPTMRSLISFMTKSRTRSSSHSDMVDDRINLDQDYDTVVQVWRRFRNSLQEYSRPRSHHHHHVAGVMSSVLTAVKAPVDQFYSSNNGDNDQSGKLYESCAVVGNSGILLNRSYGGLIDSHEMVMRLNNARTSGFEPQVGNKTTISFMNSNVLRACLGRNRCTCNQAYGHDVPVVAYVCQVAHILDIEACSRLSSSPILTTNPSLDALATRMVKYYSLKRFVDGGGRLEDWATAHEGPLFHYSSGMQAVLLSLAFCKRVSLFGFGKALSSKHHYHTNQPYELGLHDYLAEYDLYNHLALQNHSSIPFLLDDYSFSPPPLHIYS